MEANDAAFDAGASFFAKTFSLVGRTDLAERVRPSRKNRGQTAEAAGEPTESDADKPAQTPVK